MPSDKSLETLAREWLMKRTGDTATHFDSLVALLRSRDERAVQIVQRDIVCCGCGVNYAHHEKLPDGHAKDSTYPDRECGNWKWTGRPTNTLYRLEAEDA